MCERGSGTLLLLAWVLASVLAASASAGIAVYEAEDATLVGALVKSDHAGYTGTGYADYQNPSGDYVEWSVDVPDVEGYRLDFRYALASGDRPLEIQVNGVVVEPSLSFPATGSWTTWDVVSITTPLQCGMNTIRATAIGSSGANLDHLGVESIADGLVGYWTFDEGTGATAQDSSPLGNHGAVHGATWVTGRVGGALSFGGSDCDYVEAPNESDYDLQNAVSYAVWIKADPSSTTSWMGIITKGDNMNLQRYNVENYVTWQTRDYPDTISNYQLNGTSNVLDGEWHHVVVTYDGCQKRMYADGVLDSSVATTGTINTSDYPVVIGKNMQVPNHPFDGLIDDVRIYSRALGDSEVQYLCNRAPPTITSEAWTVAQVRQEYTYTLTADGYPAPTFSVSGLPTWLSLDGNVILGTPGVCDLGITATIIATATNGVNPDDIQEFQITVKDPSLVGYWTFDDGSGTTALDSSLYGDHGTVYGATWTTGRIGGALNFGGADTDYVEIPNESNYDLQDAVSYAVWIKANPASTISWMGIITKGDNMNLQRYNVEDYVTWQTRDYPDTISNYQLNGKTDVLDGKWHHIVVTYDGMQKRMYVDGVLDNSVAATGTINTGDYPLVIGKNLQVANHPFDGVIDDVRVYDRALTPSDVQEFLKGPTITSVPSEEAYAGELYSYAVTVTGNPPPTLSVYGLPAWLAFDSGTNTMSGTPGVCDAGTTWTITVIATNGVGSDAIQQFQASVGDRSLVGHWTFDDGSGATAADSSSLGNDGTVHGASWTTGKIDGALGFGGTDSDYVEIPNESDYDLSDAVSYSVWIKANPASTISWMGIVTKGDHMNLQQYSAENHVTWQTRDYPATISNYQLNGTTNVLDGEWHHIVVTYDGSQKCMYTDGAPDNSVTATGYINTTDYPVMIGKNGKVANHPFDGIIDDVRIYNRALDSSEALELYDLAAPTITSTAPTEALVGQPYLYSVAATGNPRPTFSVSGLPPWLAFNGVDTISGIPAASGLGTTGEITVTAANGVGSDATETFQITVTDLGLVGHWTFDDSAQPGRDDSGNENHLTVMGPAWTSEGRVNAALSFDGTDDYADIPLSIVNGDVGTVSFWLKTDVDFPGRTIVYYGSSSTVGNGYGTQNELHVSFDESERLEFFRGNIGAPVTGSSVYGDGRWHHVVATWDASNLCLYVDGLPVASGARGGADVEFSACHRLGRPGADQRHYGGLLDDVRLYNRALEPEEAMALGKVVTFDKSASNGAEGLTPSSIAVSLAPVSTASVGVCYVVTGGTATRGEDYILADGALVFSPGEVRKVIPIDVLPDSLTEGDETIEVTLSNTMGAALGAITVHTYTINDFGIVKREVLDAEPEQKNDKIDRIRMVASAALNDDFSDLAVTVADHVVTGFDPGVAGDAEFFILLEEKAQPDTGAPDVQITANTKLQASATGTPIPEDTGPNTPSDAVPPVVVSTSPEDSTDLVSIHTEVVVAFSEAMDRLSTEAAFSIDGGVTGSCAWPAEDAVVFTPSEPLLDSVTYTVTIGTEAQDLAGNNLTAAHGFSFTTGQGLVVDIPESTYVSPVFVEGEYWQPEGEDYQIIGNGPQGDVSGEKMDPRHFLVNIPLQPGDNTVSIRQEGTDPLVQVTGTVTWEKTDLTNKSYSTDKVTIRKGDKLLLTATSTPDVYFSDDFADGDDTDPPWTHWSGCWSVCNQEYRQTETADNRWSVAGDASWTDYTVEAKVKLGVQSNSGTGLLFRVEDQDNLYLFSINDQSKKATIWRRESGTYAELACDAGAPLPADTPYVLKVEVVGNSIKAYIDGDLVLSTTDSTHAAGRIGLDACADAWFDNVIVTAPAGTLEIDPGDGTFVEVPGGPGAPLVAAYDVAKNYVAEARIDGTSVGSLSITAVDVDLSSPIACQVTYKREKYVPVVPDSAASEVFFGAVDAEYLGDVSVKQYDTGGATLWLRPLQRGTPVLTARVGGEDGAIVTYKAVDEFDKAIELGHPIIDVDENGVGMARLVLRPHISNLLVRFDMFGSRSTFAGGLTEMEVNTDTFVQEVDPPTGETIGLFDYEIQIPVDETIYCYYAFLMENTVERVPVSR